MTFVISPEGAEMASTDAELLEEWRSGSQQAATEIHDKYAKRLRWFARKRIGARLQRRVDECDIVQSAFGSFFRRTRLGQYTVNTYGSLLSLLRKLTETKIQKHVEIHNAGMRDVNRESYIDIEKLARIIEEVPPLTAVELLRDELRVIASRLSERDARIVELLIQDLTKAEIADAVGVSRWTVLRVLDRIRILLKRKLR